MNHLLARAGTLRSAAVRAASAAATPIPRRTYVAGAAASAAINVARVGKVLLAGAITAGAAMAYETYTGAIPEKSLLGKPVAEMSEAERFVHTTVNAHARVWSGVGARVSEAHSTYVASNDPVEDRHVVARLGDDKLVLGVYDGHAGWQCSDLLSKVFHNYVARHLVTDPDRPLDALTKAFDEYDADLMAIPDKIKALGDGVSLEMAQAMLMPAMAGSVMVSSVVDGDKVYVAHAGDCRAVIGRRDARTGAWTAVELTRDHDAENPGELARMRAEHPGEESTVVARGRVLGGLQPFRSMGDARYKWPHATQDWIGRVFASSQYPYKRMPRNYLTPPYVTAHPEVAEYALDDADHFMVLATDGLWERMTNDQVVDMVAEYVARKEKGQWAHEDANAAAHVVRNAFGARDTELVASLLKIPAPLSRRYRDDITVTVVFFKPANRDTLGPQFAPETKVAPEPADVARSKLVVTKDGLDVRSGLPAAKL
ncbi:hypothetical protein H9P43_007772 [Blastocladiella emersonii ATCC 22665]|nr:hypothetical protein H9P43_007772 [Blastocladiella emersonii ATCC 22665]